MRFAFLLLVAACSVPDKRPTTDAGPGDSGIDPTAPETTITSAPPPFSGSGSATFEFQSSDPDASFLCSIDEESPVPCTSPYIRTLNDGSHGIAVRAVAAHGNSDDTPAEHRWWIDTVAPNTTLTEQPPAFDNSVDVRFDFESDEDNVVYECRVDGSEFLPCAPDDMFGPFGDGPHSFAVRAVDRAGNVDATPSLYAWTIDTLMPDTQILDAPGDISGDTTATFTFMSPDAGSGATFECSLDGAAFTTCTSPASYQSLAERMHAFRVRVRDAVGNLDPTPATREWMVDLAPPQTTISSGPSGTVATASATFVFTSSEDESTFECNLDNTGFAACTSPVNAMMLSQGPHTFAVRAIDGAGHPDPSPATASWTVDTTSPNITITAGPAADSTTGPYVTFEFTASEGSTECSLDGAAFAACTSPVSFNLPAAPHQIQIRAVDGAGNGGSVIRAWTVACAPPVATDAIALLHLDDGSQAQANATGGAAALLGDSEVDEPTDPSATTGRFGGGLAFDAGQADHVTWPAALGAAATFAVELWSQPAATPGTRTLLVSGDGRLAVRVAQASATAVVYTVTVQAAGGGEVTATSGNVPAGAWHHVLASLEEPTLRLWVDGAVAQTGGVSLGGGPSLDAVRLGDGFTGALDEVWIAATPITTDDAARTRYCPAP